MSNKNNSTIPTVKFDPNKVTKRVRADLRQNINAIPELKAYSIEGIFDAALLSISKGRALNILYDALLSLEGMNPARAGEISRSLNNKATALIQAEEQERLGIDYAYWLYSGAPCGDAIQDAAHKAANGQTYPICKGMFLNGKWTLPGRDEGCKCVSRSLIPGFHKSSIAQSKKLQK